MRSSGLSAEKVSAERHNQQLLEVRGAQLEKPGIPRHILIPKINLGASIQQVGLTSEGRMSVPTNTSDAGWFRFGPRPGDKGYAVISGHFNTRTGGEGVFNKLGELGIGDRVYIEDSEGKLITFVVKEARTYDSKEAVPNIYDPSEGRHLSLITCGGYWDTSQNSFSERLVVFTDVL